MDDQIIRYSMNLEESAEATQIVARLEKDPEALAQLEVVRKILEPLSLDKPHSAPPLNLVEKTMARIRNSPASRFPGAPKVSLHNPWTRTQEAIGRLDLMVAASLMILAGGVLFPLLGSFRSHAEKKACAQNLSQFHQSLVHYSNLQPDGSFPKVEQEGPRSFAGVFIPTLRHHGLLGEDHSVVCNNGAKRLPTETNLDQLHDMYQKAGSKTGYERLSREAAGDYAYSLGFREGNQLRQHSRNSDQHTPLLADKAPGGSMKNSQNHGGKGQNVMFVGGHVRWMASRKVGIHEDDIFVNEDQRVLAGKHQRDHVLGPSHARPGSNSNFED